ncbi:MAG: adenylylsulfate kinase [Verrucomicrobia bacterium]|nr:adenylylsulfate kinase [Verrucomicrobiota bacterium]
MNPADGHVFWLFGLSGAGKSSLAAKLREEFQNSPSRGVLMLDGDRLRNGLCRGLGFSDEDRTENLRRAAEVARLGVESGLIVIAAFITPHESQRRAVESIVGERDCSMILVNASLEICQRRDVKGLYDRAAKGGLAKMTGVGSSFEAPKKFALRIESGLEPIETSAAKLAEFARTKIVTK